MTKKKDFPYPEKARTAISNESEIPAGAFQTTTGGLKTEAMDTYARSQERRFANLMIRITRFLPRGSQVMDMGSHFLDQAVLLSRAGYIVHGFDAPAFTEIPSVKAIAERHHIALSTVHDLSLGLFGSEIPDSTFDALIFTEVIEHLAFNPLLMWRSIFRILKPNALLFVTTPNGLGIRRRIKETGKIVFGVGKGLSLTEIFGNVTYGHHWKEYGRRELIEYFAYLGIPRENIQVFRINYRQPSELWKQNKMSWALAFFLEWIPGFRKELFLVARLPAHKPSVPDPPSYS